MPDAPPVTIAIFPVRSFKVVSLCSYFHPPRTGPVIAWLGGKGRDSLVRLVLVSLALAGIAISSASASRADSIFPNPVDLLRGANVDARLTLVGTTTGVPAGGVVLTDESGAPTDLTLLITFQNLASTPPSPIVEVLLQRTNALWSRIGWIPGAGVDWTAGVVSTGGGNDAFARTATLATGATTDVLFVSAAGLDVGEALTMFFVPRSTPGFAQGSATWVPEPHTLALLTGGLALLARARRS